jgi:Rrf2 family protein
MILSRTSQYAVQALIYIATQPPGAPVLNRDIASRLNVPAPYLAKILQGLAKGNLLYSFRGRTGGFCLREAGEKINLMEIVQQTEGPSFTQSCLLGLKMCSDETACPLHFRWMPVKEKVIDLLRDTTLEKLAKAVVSGKYRLADLPGDLFARVQSP